MSAAELRTAAETLRERAEGLAKLGSWYQDDGQVWVAHDPGGSSASGLTGTFPIWAEDAPTYIATVDPKVGLALADWLDEVWAWMEEGVGLLPEGNIGDAWIGVRAHALRLARLINGGAS